MKQELIERCGRFLWQYGTINVGKDGMTKADAIIAAGCNMPEVAEFAAKLALEEYAPTLICSGYKGKTTMNWRLSEADTFKQIAEMVGFQGPILVEDKSTNTGDNLIYSQELLNELGYPSSSLIVVCFPVVQRRVKAIAKLKLPGVGVQTTAPQIPFEEFSPKILYPVMMGEVWRNIVYPAKGFQAKELVPLKALLSCTILYLSGFRRR